MAAQRGIAARADGFFHARTRLAGADDFQQRTTDSKLGIPQRECGFLNMPVNLGASRDRD
jgi:hypothetical protein